MSDLLETLFGTTNAKEFVKLFKEVEETYAGPQQFLNEALDYLPVRLYEHYYESSVPHGLLGLASAQQVQNLLAETERWRPFAQQSWFITKEKKRTPLDLNSIGEKSDGSLQERWGKFEQSLHNSFFEEAFGLAKGFINEEKAREFFRQRSLELALQDTFLGGLKFIYLFQMWRLAETLEWHNLEKILCPVLHFIVRAPVDNSLSQKVREHWSKDTLSAMSGNTGKLSSKSYKRLEDALLFGSEPHESLDILKRLTAEGIGLKTVQEALVLSASQALSNCESGAWIWPMRAFHFAYLTSHWAQDESKEQTYTLMLAAALINQAAKRSRETEQNRQLDDVAQRFCPVDPFKVLRSVISHTDPHASATAVYAILGMEEEEKDTELFQILLNQAVKNDGEICSGNDLLFLSETIDSYKESTLTERVKLPISASFFLGRVRKQYEFFGAYGF